MVALIEARLPAAPRLLDIACGPGDLAIAAARLCE
jgi:ubiquinone/menaquinone biosynthesis C-methylase UbiE